MLFFKMLYIICIIRFFKDPSGNNLEFKAMTNPDNLFAKYKVDC